MKTICESGLKFINGFFVLLFLALAFLAGGILTIKKPLFYVLAICVLSFANYKVVSWLIWFFTNWW